MTTLVVIHCTSMQAQRIHDNAIGKAYRLPDDCLRATIENFRVNGPPAPKPRSPAERVFDAMAEQFAIYQTSCCKSNI